MNVRSRQLSGECFLKKRREMVPQRRVVTFTRYIDETGNKALERVAPDEQRDALPFLKVEDADDRVEQLVFIGLEQLVAWKCVQDVQECLAVMARRWQPRALDNSSNLEPQQRDRSRVAAVRKRREESEEQVDPDGFSTWGEAAEPDRIHVRRTVNRSAAVRFSDDEQLAAAHKVLHIGRQRRQIAQPSKDRVLFVAQDPERSAERCGHSVKHIFAVAEKCEIVVVEPSQKVLDLLEFGGRDRGCGRTGQLVEKLAQALSHRLPIFDGSAYIAEDAGQCLRQARKVIAIRLARDLDLHPGFAQPRRFCATKFAKPPRRVAGNRHYRVNEQMDDAADGVDRQADRIHEKWHIVVD